MEHTDATNERPLAPLLEIPTIALLSAFAYGLLAASTFPKLFEHDGFSWTLIPIWLALAAYIASIMKWVSRDKDQSKKFAQVVWLLWGTYYILSFTVFRTAKWYEVFVMLSLVAWPQKGLTTALLAVYYAFSASSALDAGDALQVAARGILIATTLTELKTEIDLSSFKEGWGHL